MGEGNGPGQAYSRRNLGVTPSPVSSWRSRKVNLCGLQFFLNGEATLAYGELWECGRGRWAAPGAGGLSPLWSYGSDRFVLPGRLCQASLLSKTPQQLLCRWRQGQGAVGKGQRGVAGGGGGVLEADTWCHGGCRPEAGPHSRGPPVSHSHLPRLHVCFSSGRSHPRSQPSSPRFTPRQATKVG